MAEAVRGRQSIWSLLAAQAEAAPDRLLIEAADAQLTYRQTRDGADAVARVGTVNVSVNVYLKGDFLRYQLRKCGARVIVVDDAGLSSLELIIEELPVLEYVVLLGPGRPEGTVGPARLVNVAEVLVLARPDLALPDEPAPTAPAALVYTSGTTGQPKARVYARDYLLRIGLTYGLAWGTRVGDVIHTTTPMHHISGYIGIMTALMHGSSLANVSPFSASTYLDRAATVKATTAYGVGFHALAVLGRPPSPDDRRHSLRVCWFGPFPAAQADEFEQRLGVTLLSEMYAQTECGVVSYRGLGETVSHRTSGAPADDLELQIVGDGDFTALPVGAVGEIAIRALAPGVLFSGYWPDTGRADGTRWHRSGDLGRLDDFGNLTFVDRKVDSIRRRDEMVSAFELESALLRHPKITGATAFGVRLADKVDEAVAIAIVTVDPSRSAPRLARFFASELPYYAAPRFVAVIYALPRNASGKVVKREPRRRDITSEGVWDVHALGLEIARDERRAVHPRAVR